MRVSLKNENNINYELNAIKREDQSIKTEDITKSLLAMKTRDNSERVSIKPEFNNNSYKTQTFVNPFRYNFEIRNSSSKRIADQNLNPFLKKIKTGKSYEPNVEKSCVKPETDDKLFGKSIIN